jgi:hypothetical protein
MALTKATYVSKICYHTSFQEPTLSGASIAPTSDVRTSVTLLLLLIVRNNEHTHAHTQNGDLISLVYSLTKSMEHSPS